MRGALTRNVSASRPSGHDPSRQVFRRLRLNLSLYAALGPRPGLAAPCLFLAPSGAPGRAAPRPSRPSNVGRNTPDRVVRFAFGPHEFRRFPTSLIAAWKACLHIIMRPRSHASNACSVSRERECFVAATGATVRHGGAMAHYSGGRSRLSGTRRYCATFTHSSRNGRSTRMARPRSDPLRRAVLGSRR